MEDTTAAHPSEPPNGGDARGSDVVGASSQRVPTPGFADLSAPDPVVASPPESARALAFATILIGGLLGGLVGFGIGDVLYPGSTWPAVGALAGAVTGAIGLGVLANLTLRAMNEWSTAAHPESGEPGSTRSPGPKKIDS